MRTILLLAIVNSILHGSCGDALKIAVLGAGFIGKNLLAYLAQTPKNNFLVTVRSQKKFNSLKIKQKNLLKIKPLLVNSKITHQELVNNLKLFKPNLLIHLATCYIHEHHSDDINDLVSSIYYLEPNFYRLALKLVVKR